MLAGAAAHLRGALVIEQAGLGPLQTGSCRLGLAEVLFAVQDIADTRAALVSANADCSRCGACNYIERAQALATKHNVPL